MGLKQDLEAINAGTKEVLDGCNQFMTPYGISAAESLKDMPSKVTTIAFTSEKRGRDAVYDQFWDAYQSLGGRRNYRYAFAGSGWTPENCKPKYDIVVSGYSTDGYMMFAASNAFTDMPLWLEQNGISFDNSGSLTAQYAFYQNTTVERIGRFAQRSNGTLANAFQGASNLHTIEELHVPTISSGTPFQSTFTGCSALTNLTIFGVINANGFNVSACTLLTNDSLMSIIGALGNKSGDTSTTTWKVTLGATNLAKLTDADKAQATTKGWTLA